MTALAFQSLWHTSHIKCRCWMLHLDIVYMARLLFASHLIKRWNGLLLTVCSSLPPHSSSVRTSSSSSSSSSECWPNPNGLKPALLRRPNHLPTMWPNQSACQRVYLILLLLCVFAYLTAELPLTVLYLSSPFEKAATVSLVVVQQWVWGGVCVRVDAGFRQIQHPLDWNISCFT